MSFTHWKKKTCWQTGQVQVLNLLNFTSVTGCLIKRRVISKYRLIIIVIEMKNLVRIECTVE